MPGSHVRIPATSANLGPGFDSLGLALDLWNETSVALQGSRILVEVEGEGAGELPANEKNLVAWAFLTRYVADGLAPPEGVHIQCRNRIPLGSGLGSSAAAVAAGLLAANQLLKNAFSIQQLLQLGAQLEGHPDNIAAALLGGLTIATYTGLDVVARKVDIPEWQVIVALPEVKLSTQQARDALPEKVYLADTAQHIGRAALVVEALRSGDLVLLRDVMLDDLHQPHRLPLIPGASQAIAAAFDLGAAACLSGAGPSVIVFHQGNQEPLEAEMHAAFSDTRARVFHLKTINT